jgi:hypothetical protein
MILLDLFTEVFPVWKRKDLQRPTPIERRRWVWNMLHSFGGNSGMYGRMQVARPLVMLLFPSLPPFLPPALPPPRPPSIILSG